MPASWGSCHILAIRTAANALAESIEGHKLAADDQACAVPRGPGSIHMQGFAVPREASSYCGGSCSNLSDDNLADPMSGGAAARL